MNIIHVWHFMASVSIIRIMVLLAFFLSGIGFLLLGHDKASYFLIFPVFLGLYALDYSRGSLDNNEVLRNTPKIRKKVVLSMMAIMALPTGLYLASNHHYSIMLPLILAYWGAINWLEANFSTTVRRWLDIVRAAPFFIFPMLEYQITPSLWWLSFSLAVFIIVMQYLKPLPWDGDWYSRLMKAQIGTYQSTDFNRFGLLNRFVRSPHSTSIYLPSLSFTAYMGFIVLTSLLLIVTTDRNVGNPFFFTILIVMAMGFGAGLNTGHTKETLGWYSLRPGKNKMSDIIASLALKSLGKLTVCVLVAVLASILWDSASTSVDFSLYFSVGYVLYMSVIVFIAMGLLWYFSVVNVRGLFMVIINGALCITASLGAILSVASWVSQGIPSYLGISILFSIGLICVIVGAIKIPTTNWS